MKSSLVFAKRNIKEIFKSPVSCGFGIAMPIAILLIMQIIVKSIGDDTVLDTVPMFLISNFIGKVLLFSSSFLTMFIAMIISQINLNHF